MTFLVTGFVFENLNIIICIFLFLLCIIIGFLGEKRFEKNNTLSKFINKKYKIKNTKENSKEMVVSKINDVINCVDTQTNNISSSEEKDLSVSDINIDFNNINNNYIIPSDDDINNMF